MRVTQKEIDDRINNGESSQKLNNMQRQITDKEIQKAQEIYLVQSKAYIDRLTEIHKWLTPKVIKTETGVKVFCE